MAEKNTFNPHAPADAAARAQFQAEFDKLGFQWSESNQEKAFLGWKLRTAMGQGLDRERQAGEAVARIAELEKQNRDVCMLLLKQDREGAIAYAKGLLCSESGGKYSVSVIASLPAHQAVQADSRALALLRESRNTLLMWRDVAPAVSLLDDIDKFLAAAPSPDGKAEQAEAPSAEDAAYENEHPAAKRMRLEFEAKYGSNSALMRAANNWFNVRTQYNEAWNRDREQPVTETDVEEAERAMLATQPTASNAGEREAPKWPNVETAMEDPMFQQARAIMGTNTWFQDNALRNVINYVLSTIKPPACKGIPRPGCNYLAPCDTSCNKCGEIHHHYQMVAALATKPPAGEQKPVAVLRFERGTPGRENDMPRVVSCDWKPDGEYHVYLRPQPEQVAQDSERWKYVANLFDHMKRSRSENMLDAMGLGTEDPLKPLAEIVDEAIRAARALGEGGAA